ncbi:hypothetical protein Q7P37_003007 [Cladosporium fusiforme]
MTSFDLARQSDFATAANLLTSYIVSVLQAENTIPPGQHTPFLRATEDDHRDRIVISSAIGISFVLLAIVSRTIIRKFVKVVWGIDDTVLVISFGLYLVQSSLVTLASATGLGATTEFLSQSQRGSLQTLFYASNIFYVLALDTSKIASILFVHRLTLRNTAFLLWEIHAAFSCTFEVAIFVAPLWIARRLQRPLAVKAEVAAPFALRLFITFLTGMRLRSFDKSGFVTDSTLAEAEYVAWTQWELTYSVLAATFPSAQRSFLDLATFYSNGYRTENGSSKNQSALAGESFEMRTLSGGRYATAPVPHEEGSAIGEEEDGDDSSQRMIITKQTTYEVSVDPMAAATGSRVNGRLVSDDDWKA